MICLSKVILCEYGFKTKIRYDKLMTTFKPKARPNPPMFVNSGSGLGLFKTNF